MFPIDLTWLKHRVKNKGVVLPFHNYIGPGNPLYSGEPVNRADVVAQKHDWEYHTATSQQQVRDSDSRARENFKDNFILYGGVSDALGYLGLSAKSAAESVVGHVLYPGNLPERSDDVPLDNSEYTALIGKRKFTSIRLGGGLNEKDNLRKQYILENNTMSGSRTAEEPALGEPPTKMLKTDTGSARSMGTGRTGGDGPMHAAPTMTFQKGREVFKHKRIISTFVHNYQYLKHTVPSDGGTGFQWNLITPFAYVPADVLGFYLSDNEFGSIPPSGEATLFTCDIRPMGYRLPFQTQASGTTFANSITDAIGAYAYGLNNTFNGDNMKPTYNATNVTQIDSLIESKPMNDNFWPGTITAADVKDISAKIPSSMSGNIIPLSTYFVYVGDLVAGAAAEPLLSDYVHTFDLNNKGGVNIHYEYRPDICILRPVTTGPARYLLPKDTKAENYPKLLVGHKLPTEIHMTFTRNYTSIENDHKLATKLDSNLVTLGATADPNVDSNWKDWHIEQSGLVTRGVGQIASAYLPPTLHIGGLPLDAHIKPSDDKYIQPLIVMWEVLTECVVEWNLGFTHATNLHA